MGFFLKVRFRESLFAKFLVAFRALNFKFSRFFSGGEVGVSFVAAFFAASAFTLLLGAFERFWTGAFGAYC